VVTRADVVVPERNVGRGVVSVTVKKASSVETEVKGKRGRDAQRTLGSDGTVDRSSFAAVD
jgi:hypothetical protein